MTHERTASDESSPAVTHGDDTSVAAPGAARVAAPAAEGGGAHVSRRKRRTSRGRSTSRWVLLGAIVLASATLGWSLGRAQRDGTLVVVEASYGVDASASASASADAGADAAVQAGSEANPVVGEGSASPSPAEAYARGQAREIGRLKAEMLRLRVLFQRLAEVAELDQDGEFDIDFDIDTLFGNGEPLSGLDPADTEALALLIERFDPMVRQSERMQRIFSERRQDFDRRLSGRPLASGSLSSGFGLRVDPLSGEQVTHRGLDFVGTIGEPVLALADGVVTYAGPNGGYGLLVELEHAGGLKTRYAHNNTTNATLGAAVGKGEQIATLGSSGRSTGPHLHLEVRKNGKATDPRFYVR